MKKLMLISGLALLLAGLVFAKSGATAKADLVDSKGANVGTVKLQETSKGVSVAIAVSNLPPGVHGFHIHAVGKCEAPGFTTAGGHFNPEGKKHGWENPEGHHAGDLQNLTVDANGKAKVKVVVTGVTLGDGPNSLFQPKARPL